MQVSEFNRNRIENNLLLKNGLKSLAPNYKIPIPFDYLIHYFQANLPLEYLVTVTYWWKTPLQSVVSETLLQSAVALISNTWTEQLNHVIDNLSKLGSMELDLDSPEGVMFTLPFLTGGGSSKEDFDNLGDSTVADIKAVIELIEKEKEPPLNGDDKEETQLPMGVEEPAINHLEQSSE